MIIDMTNDFNDIYISNIKYFGASQAADAFTQLEAITKDIVQKTKENQTIPMKLNVLVIGASKFLSQTNSVSQDGWKYLFEEVEKTKQVNYMFVDCKDKIRDFTSSNEAREYLSDQDGLYIGNGFDSQSVINTKVDDRSLRDNGIKDTSDGVLVTNGVPVAVKIIQEWNGDQNGQ